MITSCMLLWLTSIWFSPSLASTTGWSSCKAVWHFGFQSTSPAGTDAEEADDDAEEGDCDSEEVDCETEGIELDAEVADFDAGEEGSDGAASDAADEPESDLASGGRCVEATGHGSVGAKQQLALRSELRELDDPSLASESESGTPAGVGFLCSL
nr:CCAAT-box DNA binding protein subunit B [Ipomoea batatas]